jgi:DNA-binding response OmpR family regulator
MRSLMSQIKEIREGLDLGVDDYLVFPHNPIQIRSRVLVGMRWITYIDSIIGTSTAKSNTAAQARSSS